MKVCSVEGCERRAASLGYCNTHYQQDKRGIKDLKPIVCKQKGICKMCGKPEHAQGLCNTCYARALNRGELGHVSIPKGSGQAFFNKVASIQTDQCIEWPYARSGIGYGHIRFQNPYGERAAHRYSHARFIGPIPDGLHVLHACDNPACVNPRHLRLGTPTDNMREMHARNRANNRRGEEAPKAKMTEEQATEIIGLLSSCSDMDLANRFGVSRMAIWLIRKGKNWKHLPR